MKKLKWLFYLLLFLNSTFAQTVSIKSNPATPSANIIIGYSNYNVTEALYMDAELGTNTFTVLGSEIRTIGVYVSTLGSPTTANGYKIWMKNTTMPYLAASTYSTAGYTLVYSGSINLNSSGLNKIYLNTPFTRLSGNNLQVMFERNDGIYNAGFTFDVSLGNNTSTTALTCRRYNGTAAITAASNLGVSSFRPAIQFTAPPPNDASVRSFVNPIVSCYSSTQRLGVVIGNEGTASIPVGAASVYLKIGGANNFSSSLTNSTIIAPNSSETIYFSGINLNNAGSNYDTAIVTLAGDSSSSNNRFTSSLTTARIISSFPATEGAEGTLNVIPFSSIVSGLYNAWTFLNVISTTGAYNNGYSPDSLLPRTGGGSNFFLFNSWDNVAGTKSRVYSHCVTIPTTGIPRVSFWMSHDSAFVTKKDSLYVVVSNDKGSSWNRVAGFSRPTSGLTKYTWKLDSVDLSLYKGQTIQVGFEGVSNYGNSFGLDDITIYIAPCVASITKTTVSACNTYTWTTTGQTYTTTGTYIRSYTNSCGTASADTLKLTINKGTFTSTSVIACNTYTWSANATSYTASGTYTRSYNNTAGCASIDTLKLTINKSTYSASTVYACNSYTWVANNNTIYTVSGDYVRSYTNTSGCSSFDTLRLKISNNINTKFTQVACGSYNWFGVVYTTSGNYSRVNACGAVDTLSLTVNRLVVPTFTQINPICKDSSFVLLTTSTNGIVGTWTPAINNQITTKYTFTPNSSFCASLASMTVTVYQPTAPLFTQVYPICVGGTFTLPTTSNNDISGTWSPAINNQATTTYTFTPDGGQCAAKVTMTVTVNSTNATPTFTQVAAICKGGSFTLPTVSNNGYIGTWSPAINNQTTTTYTFTPRAGQCANTATMTVTINQPSTPTFSQVAPICKGGIFNLPNTSNNGVIGTWSPALNNQITTTYSFTPSSAFCSNVVTMTVVVNQPIVPTFNAIAPICIGDIITLPTTSVNSITGTWSPSFNNQRTTTYTFTPNSGFCAATTTLTVTVNALKTPTFSQVAQICKGGSFVLPNLSNDSISGLWTPAINNQSTTIYTFIPSSGQCANTTTMTVVVKQPSYSFDTVSACNNYVWNAQTYSVSGDYTVNRINASGCDSIATLNLTIKQPTSSVTNITICQGTSYLFSGDSYTASGIYTKTLVNAVSCDSFAILNLTVDPTLTSSLLSISGVRNINKCDTLQTYSVVLYNRATYRWTVTGTGNYIKSGSTSNVAFIVMKVVGTVSAITTTPCNTTSITTTLSVSKSTPTTPGTIYQSFTPTTVAANTNVCLFNQNAYLLSKVADTFRIRAVTNATGYYWKVPTGAVMTRVNDTTIAVVFSNTQTLPDTVKVYSLSACDTSLAKSLPLTKVVVATSGSVYKSFNANSTSGTAAVTNVCYLVGGGSETYKVRKVSTASSYNWVLKYGTNAVITHLNALGFIDTAIRITFNTGFTKDTLLLNTVNGCGASTTIVKVPLNATLAPPNPTNITASTSNYNPCIATSVQYSVVNTVPTSTQTPVSVYRWTIPAYTSITVANADSSIITLSINPAYTGGTLSVKALSACAVSSSTKSVTLTYYPPAPTSITSNTGNYNPCIKDTVQFTVLCPAASTSQSPMVKLRWTLPSKTTITYSNLDSSVITLRFDSLYAGGTLAVKAQSSCGVFGSTKSIVLTNTPPTPTSIMSSTGIYNACIGDTVQYTVVCPAPTTSQSSIVKFSWTIPSKTRIVLSNADSSVIKLVFDSLYTGGTLSVKGQTICGVLGASKSQALTHTGCAVGAKNLYVKSELNKSKFEVSIFPNPTTNNFNLIIKSDQINNASSVSKKAMIKLSDVQGRVIDLYFLDINKINVIGESLKHGVYFMEVTQGENVKTEKLIKL